FLERMRALMDEFKARPTVGEDGDSHLSIKLMGEYTSGRKMHMANSFEMLGPDFSAAHFRSRIESFFRGAPEGWPCWAFSNHDVPRHVGRWLAHAKDRDALAKQAAAMLLSFEGSVCLYQGEELGLVNTDLDFDELTDPDGIAFWPEYKGRDGCRTPMVWDAGAPNAGFSRANQTWLPVKAPQQARAVSTQEGRTDSVLAFYRRMLALRRAEPELKLGDIRFLDLPEPVLGYTRGGTILCLFNLSARPAVIDLDQPLEELLTQGATIAQGRVKLAANGVLIGRKAGGRGA
ncbi:MAG: alpha-amylase family glycosyl hydrolase, partial [Paracoccus sp. (in: a-proteobacteria)]